MRLTTPNLEPTTETIHHDAVGVAHVLEVFGSDVLEGIFRDDWRHGRHVCQGRRVTDAYVTALSGSLDVLRHVMPEHRALGTKPHPGDPLVGGIECVQHAIPEGLGDDWSILIQEHVS